MFTIPPRLTIKELHSLLDDSLVVRHIAEPLLTCNAADDERATKKMMAAKNFDVLGLKENGVLTGYVRRTDLRDGKCGSRNNRFRSTQIVASQTPLIELLPLMRTGDMYFVLERTEITGLVTQADLQKWPVRMLFFGLVSLLEMYLLQIVRVCYPGTSFLTRLTPKRAEKAEELFQRRKARNEDIDLADCLQMGDKVELMCKNVAVTDYFKLPSGQEGKKHFKKMEDLRDKLAHAQDLSLGVPWTQVIGDALSAELFLKECERSWDEFLAKFGQGQTH